MQPDIAESLVEDFERGLLSRRQLACRWMGLGAALAVMPRAAEARDTPHELPRLVRSVGRPRGCCFWLESWTTPTIPPGPQYREPMPEDLVSQRCA